MKGHPIPYSAEELAWIEANTRQPRKATHAAFCDKFGRADVSLQAFHGLCKRRGWHTGSDGRFVKGQESWNKGKPMPYNENSARTRFKPGNRTGRANENWKPIGTERLSKEGYVERKVHDGLPLQSRWRAVHRIEWEAANGPIPTGHCLKCLGADKTNTDPSNWALVPRALLPRLAGGNRYRDVLPYDQAAPELKLTVLALAQLEHEARKARKARQA